MLPQNTCKYNNKILIAKNEAEIIIFETMMQLKTYETSNITIWNYKLKIYCHFLNPLSFTKQNVLVVVYK